MTHEIQAHDMTDGRTARAIKRFFAASHKFKRAFFSEKKTDPLSVITKCSGEKSIFQTNYHEKDFGQEGDAAGGVRASVAFWIWLLRSVGRSVGPLNCLS